MKKICVLIIGLSLGIIALTGCGPHGDHQANAVVSVTPGTNVNKGTTVHLDANESEYSDHNIEWLLNGQRLGICHHKAVCTLQMNKKGRSKVTLKVKISETTSLGNVVFPESKDETTVVFRVTN